MKQLVFVDPEGTLAVHLAEIVKVELANCWEKVQFVREKIRTLASRYTHTVVSSFLPSD